MRFPLDPMLSVVVVTANVEHKSRRTYALFVYIGEYVIAAIPVDFLMYVYALNTVYTQAISLPS